MSLHIPFRLARSVRPSITPPSHANHVRHASLNSAIGRGIRKTRTLNDYPLPEDTSRRGTDRRRGNDLDRPRHSRNKETRKSWGREELDEDEFIKTGNFRGLPREHQSSKTGSFQSFRRDNDRQKDYDDFPSKRQPFRRQDSRQKDFDDLPSQRQPHRRDGNRQEDFDDFPPKRRFPPKEPHHRYTDKTPERVKSNVSVPESIPYTTPASQFIYGTSAVEAALRCGRRQLYKLYLYQAAGEQLSPSKIVLRKLALSKGIPVKMAFAGWDRLLDKVSAGRAHNGCVVEASPLPRLPVKFLRQASAAEDHFSVELAPQSREEAAVNGTDNRIAIQHSPMRRRNPVVVLLDGVVDPGNLGAIIRSAYYLGVDAIVFAGKNCAPLSATSIKSSAGAAENMTLLQVSNEVDFIRRSKDLGWRFYAADAPGSTSTFVDTSAVASNEGQNGNGIGDAPSVIMLGSEGDGLSHHIRSHADAIVSIPGSRLGGDLRVESDPARVDSLNVSVAAALLMEMFLRVPLAVGDVPAKGNAR